MKKFPKLPQKPIVAWRIDLNNYYALVDRGDHVKIYYWDGIAKNFIYMEHFTKINYE